MNITFKLNILAPIVAFSAGLGGLSFAFGTEFFLGLKPCELCLYQRIPYAISIICGLCGLISNSFIIKKISIGLSGLVFFIGAIIAFFHIGVEQHWWNSTILCGGGLTNFEKIDNFFQALSQKQKPVCNIVEWSFLDLSMATYNLLLSIGLTLIFSWAWQTMRMEGK